MVKAHQRAERRNMIQMGAILAADMQRTLRGTLQQGVDDRGTVARRMRSATYVQEEGTVQRLRQCFLEGHS
jgi:hypothetical protein